MTPRRPPPISQNRQDLYQRAAEIFTEYLVDFPNHPNAEMAWWYLGNSYYQSGQIEDGKRCFSTLLNRYGKGKWAAAAAYTLAADHYNKAEYAFAAPIFERYAAMPRNPKNARGQLLRRKLLPAAQAATARPSPRSTMSSRTRLAACSRHRPKRRLDILRSGRANPDEALRALRGSRAGRNVAKVRGEAALHAALTATKLDQTGPGGPLPGAGPAHAGHGGFPGGCPDRADGQPVCQKRLQGSHRRVPGPHDQGQGEKEASRLMVVARAYMRLKQPSEALALFREVERLLTPETHLRSRRPITGCCASSRPKAAMCRIR